VSKIDTSLTWGPRVLRRDKLYHRRWAFVVEAPFEMAPSEMETLIGMSISVDGALFVIRGLVGSIPRTDVLGGDPIELLVASAT